MSENFSIQPRETNGEAIQPIAARQIVTEAINDGVVIQNGEDLADKMGALIERYGIMPTFFEDIPSSYVFMALASELEVEEGPGLEHEHAFNDAVMKKLLGPHAANVAKEETHGITSSTEGYEKLKNPELTERLKQYIASDPDIAQLKKRLGLSEDEEFDIRVLNILGDTPPPYALTNLDDQFKPEELREKIYERNILEAHIQRLRGNNKTLQTLTGISSIPWAWANIDTEDLESSFGLLPAPIAEGIITAVVKDHERAILLHELTHTKRSLFLPGASVIFGLGLEELRAEHMSGNRNGYLDLKAVDIMMRAYTGQSVTDLFEPDGHPFDKDRFAKDVARTFGLSGLARLYTMVPLSYLELKGDTPESIYQVLNNRFSSISYVAHFFKAKALEEQGPEVVNNLLHQWVDTEMQTLPDYITDPLDGFYMRLPLSMFEDVYSYMEKQYPDKVGTYDWKSEIEKRKSE